MIGYHYPIGIKPLIKFFAANFPVKVYRKAAKLLK